MEELKLPHHRRFVHTLSVAQRLPLIVESLGHNSNQEKISRPDGYPYYHWIQTAEGEGTIIFEGKTLIVPPHAGVLLYPRVPHSYEAGSDTWSTYYLTFGGPAAESVLSALELDGSSYFRWPQDAPMTHAIDSLLHVLEHEHDVFGLTASSETYRFLIALSRYGQAGGNRPAGADNLDKIRATVEWMEAHVADPDVGLQTIASVLGLSGRRLHSLFQQEFGLSPYAYFIRLRIRIAKEMLIGRSTLTVKDIADKVGFRDASHFVATFRKLVGMPPEQFRKLH